eukprot:scaffold2693_cov139-Isochrysis_galbana.AAC.6
MRPGREIWLRMDADAREHFAGAHVKVSGLHIQPPGCWCAGKIERGERAAAAFRQPATATRR